MSEPPESSNPAELHGFTLKKELGLKDLVLMQFVCVVSTTWLAVAGKAGPSHILFWLAALLLFYVPLALVVSQLQRQTPLEGGLYQWTRTAFGKSAAFMVGWNLWLFSVISTGLIGLQVATYGSYAFGEEAAWMLQGTWFRAVSIAAVVALLAGLSSLGLGASRWMHNASGIALALTCTVLLLLPLIHYLGGSLPSGALAPHAVPPSSWLFDLNLLGKLGFGAFCGFEYVAIMSAECHDPRRTVVRSIWLASAGVAAVYILGTVAVLAFVPSDRIDSTSPIAQVLTVGLRPLGAARYVALVAICVLFVCSIGGGSVNFTSATRLPMVAGWDSALPAWFARLHPQRKTPVNAIVATAFLALVTGLISLIGVRNEESFQLLLNVSLMFYALAYLALFALPFVRSTKTAASRAPLWLRFAALSGFLMTLLFILTAVFPIIDVASIAGFSTRVIGTFVGCNLVGAALLVLAYRRRRSGIPIQDEP